MKYTAIQSFVESSFFTKLADLKLNEFMLDSSSRQVSAFMTPPAKLTKFNDKPIVNLDYSGFSPPEKDHNVWLSGTLHNYNTIEEFKNADKLALLKLWGQDIHSQIKNQNYTGLDKFHLITFCDLKKYKFYYWFCFPALHSLWTMVESSVDDKLHEKTQQYIDLHSDRFFQVNDGFVLLENIDTSVNTFVFVDSCLGDVLPSVQLKNYLFLLATKGYTEIELFQYRSDGTSRLLKLVLDEPVPEVPKVTGWERSVQGKLGPKLADLGSLIDPHQLADQAVDLNLKLMKWRVAPDIDLDVLKSQKVLLLGAGTLGSYVSRTLLGWGVRNITFVDNGRVSYSNPVRQPLFAFKDCFGDGGHGMFKATRAAESLKEIFPGVNSTGHNMEVLMMGHAVVDEEKQKQSFDDLCRLFDEHDVIFLLMDSRESRWLPTLLGMAKNKIVLNAALGFDSYLVMRHGSINPEGGERLGCYYCNDVVAPNDSLSDRTLDQMCTVTRPGVAAIASALAVEVLVSILQHPKRQYAPVTDKSKFGEVPHQIRGFLGSFSQTKLQAPCYKHCSACSEAVLDAFDAEGWEFVKRCLNDTAYLEQVCGLAQVQEEAEKAAMLLEDFDFDEEEI